MTVGRRGLDLLLLTVAGILCCLLLLSTTSSGAQATAVAQSNGATAVAGGDNCLDSQNGDNTTTGQQTGTDNTSNNTTTSDNTNNNTSDNNSNTTSDNNNTSDNTSDTTSGNNNTTDNTTDNTSDNNTTDNTSDTTGDDQEDADNAQSSDTGNNTNDECVVANTVPDKSLPFTGAPVKSQGPETSAKKDTKSDDGTKQTNSNDSKKQANSNDSKKQTNSDNAKKQTNSNHSGTQKKSKRVETLNYRGKKLQIEDRSKEPRQGKSGGISSKSTTAQEKAPNWPVPSPEEAASVDQIRRFAPNPNSQMTLSVRALGVYDAPITDFDSPDKLDNGLVRVPETSRPWDRGDKNVYVAGHYLGYDGTPSRLIFYNLHNLKKGDKLTVKDSLGRIYNYQVSEKFAVSPDNNWVMGQVRGRDMLTLQTCIPPDFGQRLVVRADRVKNT